MRRIARRAVDDPPTVRRTFKRSVFRETLISGLVAVILIIGVAWNLPESAVKRTIMPVLEPVAQGLGVEQRWQMYAPDVIRRMEYIKIQVTMDDGSTRAWVNPSGDKVIGHFAWYHWQKLKENLPRDPTMQADIAHWAVRELTDPSEKPVHVQIIMRTEQLPPPGQDGPRNTAVETLYSEYLTERP